MGIGLENDQIREIWQRICTKLDPWGKLSVELKIIASGIWTITSPCKGAQCDLEDWLAGVDKQHQKHAQGFVALFDHVAEVATGPTKLPIQKCHIADFDEAIWEFIKGGLRILWFYGKDNRVIVCSHCFVKIGKKTPQAEKDQAIKLKAQYMADQEVGNIKYYRDDENENL